MNDLKMKVQNNLDFLVFCLAILFCYFNIGNVVTDEYGFIAYRIASKHFSDHAVVDYYFLGFVGIGSLLRLLCEYADGINWMGLFEISVALITCYLYLKIVKEICVRYFNNNWFALLVLLFSSLVFIDIFLVVSHTKSSLLLCGLSLYILSFESISIRKRFLYNLSFVFGMLIRPESGVGMLIFVSAAFLIYKWDIRSLLNNFRYVYLFAISVILTIALVWSASDDFLIEIEPEIEYKFLQGYVKDIDSQKNFKDSVKYMAAVNGIIFDPDVLTPQYLRSIQEMPSTGESVLKVKNGINAVANLYHYYNYIVFTMLLFLFLSLVKRKYALFFRLLAIDGFLFLLMFGLSINSGLSNRHIQPFFLMLLLINLTYFFRWTGKLQFSSPKYWSLMIIFGIMLLNNTTEKYKINNDVLAKLAIDAENRFRKMDEHFKNRIIVGTLSSQNELFNQRFSILNQRVFNNKYILFDCYNFSMLGQYRAYLDRLTNGNAYPPDKFFTWLSDHNALYLVSDEMGEVTQLYINTIYDMSVSLDNDAFQVNLGDEDRIYTRIKKVTLRH